MGTATSFPLTQKLSGIRLLGSIARNRLAYMVLVPWSIFTLFIFIWLVFASLKSNSELYANLWGLPQALNFENYAKAWNTAHIGSYFLNSLVIVSSSVIITVLVGAMGAYALARIPFPGNTLVQYGFIAGMGIPIQLLLVPLFMLLNKFRLVNSHLGLVLSYAAYLLPFTVFLLVSFFRSLPTELEESAALDGASDFTVFWKIMLPLSMPGIITAVIFNFITLWNEYLLALILLAKPAKWTVSLGLYNLRVVMGSTADWVSLFAGVIIMSVPVMTLYIFLSERVISGLTLGATKG